MRDNGAAVMIQLGKDLICYRILWKRYLTVDINVRISKLSFFRSRSKYEEYSSHLSGWFFFIHREAANTAVCGPIYIL